jgi:hypothetical protein
MAKAKKFKLNTAPKNLTETPPQPETMQPPAPQLPEESQPEASAVSSVSETAQPPIEPDWSNVPLPADEISAAASGAVDMVGEGAAPALLTPEGFISYEAFHEGFCKAFDLCGHIGQLQTLLQAPKQPSCPDATRAIYDIARETPALHFVIKPGSIWVQRAFAIGSFAVPVTLACVAEIRIKAAVQQLREDGAALKETLNKEGEESHDAA